ncbi:MAG: hypothetical protein M3R61_05575 [Chloroflexota bacterium]|nr:hypothetical protein [Chloroflexota bacterium]
MDTLTWPILGGLALIIVIAALVMLNRSWGNFPNRAGTLPPAGTSAPGMSRLHSAPAVDWEDLPPLGTPERPAAAIRSTSHAGGLVPIEHPLVRRSAAQALERGGPITRYIVRQGEQLYFDFSQIADPEQRHEAYDLMQRFNAGQDVDIAAMLKMVNRLFKQ